MSEAITKAAEQPFTPAQRMRLWQNTEKGKSATSLGAFERICQAVEAAHRIGQESPQPAVPVVSDEQIDPLVQKHARATWSGSQQDWDVAEFSRLGLVMFANAILAMRPAVEPMTWPKGRDVGRYGDMSPGQHLRVGLDSDNDVYVSVWDEDGGASVEFCNPGGGGGGSSRRTREALIALMVAIEADNAERPEKDWWARRNGITAKAEGGA